MVRLKGHLIAFTVSVAGAALLLSVAALAQNSLTDRPAFALTYLKQRAAAETAVIQNRREIEVHRRCGNAMAHFLKVRTSPYGRDLYGSVCDLREDW